MQELQIHYGRGAHTQYASKFYLHAVTEALQFLQGHSVQVGRTWLHFLFFEMSFPPLNLDFLRIHMEERRNGEVDGLCKLYRTSVTH